MEKYSFSQAERNMYEKLSVPFAVYQYVDKRVVTLALSDGFCELLGYEDREKAYYDMDNNMYRDTHPDDVSRIADAASHFAIHGGRYEVIYRSRKSDGSWRVIHAVGKHVYTPTGERLAEVTYTDEGSYADEDALNRGDLNRALSCALRDESLLKASYYDHLTGLPGMTYFFELAEAGRDAIRRGGRHPVMLYMDLSGMKFYNLRYGFAEGDLLLRGFAKLLVRFFSNDNCCRIGSDHFAAFTVEEGLEETLNRLFRECRNLDMGRMLPVRVGIYQDSEETVPASIACDRAKLACDELKNNYSYGFHYYDQALRKDAERRHYILENLDRAIAEKWIQVYYQPIVRTVTGRVSDEEALSRWIDPEMGLLSPADFIPVLEDAGVICKLDLYVLEEILDKLRLQREAGFVPVPQSVNLSRSDFQVCDMVEEIRTRVDSAGIPREMITIEITESTIGSNMEFMKEQIRRFQQLGFPVWMDDFGSGYSSLDLLQSINFNLIKFDMSFMKKLKEGDNGRVVLRELVKMATALGIDTVCEGVETEEQVRFLQEIGCSKLQGYYFSKPASYQERMRLFEAGDPLRYENLKESSYYETIGRMNLYDLSVIANDDEIDLRSLFNTMPMGILEVLDDKVRFIRSTMSLRAFLLRSLGIDLSLQAGDFVTVPEGTAAHFIKLLIRQCCSSGNHALIDETLSDGSIMHAFARRIDTNPVTGASAVAVALLSITDAGEGTNYANIARALATDYYNIYYVDLENEDFIEYTSAAGENELAYERRGKNFFEECRRAANRIYREDQEEFFRRFTRENIIRRLDEQGVFTASYRLMDTGTPMYASMKIVRTQPGDSHIVIGISIVDSRLKEKALAEQLLQERLLYGRIASLASHYILLYAVDPVTERYFEFGTGQADGGMNSTQEEEDFFLQAAEGGIFSVAPEDLPAFRKSFTKENVLQRIDTVGSFGFRYHMLLGSEKIDAVLRAAVFEESGGTRLIIGVKQADIL